MALNRDAVEKFLKEHPPESTVPHANAGSGPSALSSNTAVSNLSWNSATLHPAKDSTPLRNVTKFALSGARGIKAARSSKP